MSCSVHGPDSFAGLCQQIFRNLLAEERILSATPSTPVEFLEADYLQGLSTASFTHLVLLFISSLLNSDSFLPRPLGFLKVLLPQTWCPTQVTQFAVIHEERKSRPLVSEKGIMIHSLLQVRNEEDSLSTSFILTLHI